MYLKHLTLFLAVQFSAQNCIKIANRIFMGKIAKRNSIPYQVGLYIQQKFSLPDNRAFCGGSLLTTKFVLTAAHCLEDVKIITVLLATYSIKTHNRNTVVMQTNQFRMHKKYNSKTLDNDIGVVQLPKPVKLSKLIATVNLPTRFDDKKLIIGKYGKLSGWGFTSDKSRTPNRVLKELRVRLVDDKACKGFRPTPSNICGFGEDRGSSCMGDSGGPLILENTNTQIGIVSYGTELGCTKGYAHIYTNVRRYIEWICNNTDYKIND